MKEITLEKFQSILCQPRVENLLQNRLQPFTDRRNTLLKEEQILTVIRTDPVRDDLALRYPSLTMQGMHQLGAYLHALARTTPLPGLLSVCATPKRQLLHLARESHHGAQAQHHFVVFGSGTHRNAAGKEQQPADSNPKCNTRGFSE